MFVIKNNLDEKFNLMPFSEVIFCCSPIKICFYPLGNKAKLTWSKISLILTYVKSVNERDLPHFSISSLLPRALTPQISTQTHTMKIATRSSKIPHSMSPSALTS
ncbi:unnamed protein product [Blepharisma stoltei]|uniref:Uncharacterized protein n=1 Tax=Blepharisma stoltei TaxID=1481888 RepID=A0AAU9KC49_9CILI|nr:unnamed protein product [Blepharisma stoltei]